MSVPRNPDSPCRQTEQRVRQIQLRARGIAASQIQRQLLRLQVRIVALLQLVLGDQLIATKEWNDTMRASKRIAAPLKNWGPRTRQSPLTLAAFRPWGVHRIDAAQGPRRV